MCPRAPVYVAVVVRQRLCCSTVSISCFSPSPAVPATPSAGCAPTLPALAEQNRLDQSVSLQHRGLLRLPPTSTLTSARPPNRSLGANPGDDHVQQPSDLPFQQQMQQQQHHQGVPISSTAQALPPSRGNRVTSGETVSTSVSASTTDQGPPGQDTLTAIKLGKRARPSSVSAPRLEKWPDFPTPFQAFARAAPLEAPAGLLPPSRRFLGYIHQVCFSVGRKSRHSELQIFALNAS